MRAIAPNTITRSKSGKYLAQHKTHCNHNHKLNPDNAYIRSNGKVQCRKCGAAATSALRIRRILASLAPRLRYGKYYAE